MTPSSAREKIARIVDPVAFFWLDDLKASPPEDQDDPRLFCGGEDRVGAALAKADAILLTLSPPAVSGAGDGWKLVEDQDEKD